MNTVDKVVDKAVPVPCKIVPVDKPQMPGDTIVPTDSLFDKVKKLIAELETRIGYEKQLEAAVQACQ